MANRIGFNTIHYIQAISSRASISRAKQLDLIAVISWSNDDLLSDFVDDVFVEIKITDCSSLTITPFTKL